MKRFEWTMGFSNVLNAWISNSCYYTTDENEEGLFFVDLERNERRQLIGCYDFSTKGLKPESKKAKIRKFLKERYASF